MEFTRYTPCLIYLLTDLGKAFHWFQYVVKISSITEFIQINTVGSIAINCTERLVSEMTCYVTSGTLNPTHSLTHSLVQIKRQTSGGLTHTMSERQKCTKQTGGYNKHQLVTSVR